MAQSNHTPHLIDIEGSVYMMAWSPDGSRIAVSAASTPTVDDSYMAQQVFVIDYRTREVVSEVDNEGKIGQVIWSPDGTRLAIRAGMDINDPIDGRILIVSSEGGTPRIIDRDFEGKYEHIEWTGNNEISFLASIGTGYSDRNHSSGRPIQKLQAGSGCTRYFLFLQSSWRCHIIYGKYTYASNRAVFLSTRRNAQPERITHHNPWLAEAELGRQEVVRYTARDGSMKLKVC